MGAREELLAILYGEGEYGDTREATADRILTRHAHELAERLRARSLEIAGYDDAYRHAADLIDPEVE